MFTLTVEDGEPLRVVRYWGQEAISESFEFQLHIATGDPSIPFSDLVGKNAVFAFGRDPEHRRHVHGVVRRFAFGHQNQQRASYIVQLVPHAWRMKLRRTCRIFQGLTAPQIIAEVLAGAGIDPVEMSVSGSYATRELCVQYRESDWDFVNRLMEEEGLFYYFEHTPEQATLIVADSASVHEPIAGDPVVKMRGNVGALAKGEHVSELHYGEEVRVGHVRARDHNFETPHLTLEQAAQADVDDDLELYDYPGAYPDDTTGAARVGRWLEAQQVLRKSGVGRSVCERFVPGHTFTLGDTAEEDIRDDLNQAYLLARVEHEGGEPTMDGGGEPQSYQNRFWVVPAAVAYRPLPRTPRPSIRGVQTAVVVGPVGEEIYTDPHGRIKVQFHWDRVGKNDEHSSCWVRVRQAWAGRGWGTMFLPRVGHEVVVDFIEGNPDRPVVTGSLYHATNVVPYTLPDDKTKSTIKSSSTPGGGGFNELRFEDQAGSEEVYLHGQKDWTIEILNDKNQSVGHDESLTVGNDRTEHIGRNKSITVVGDHGEGIGGSESVAVSGDETRSVGGNRSVTVSGNHIENVSGDQGSTVTGTLTQSVGAAMTLSVAETKTEAVTAASTETVGADKSLTVGGSFTEDVAAQRTLVAGEKVVIRCGSSTITVAEDGAVTIDAGDISVTGSGNISISGQDMVVDSKGSVDLKASGKIKVKGSNVEVN